MADKQKTSVEFHLEEGKPVPAGMQVITPVRFDVSGFQLVPVGNEVILLCTQYEAGAVMGAPGLAMSSTPVVQLSMDIRTAKDMLLILTDRITEHEKAWGEVESEYSRKRQAEKAK
jgi:hypothetical protein